MMWILINTTRPTGVEGAGGTCRGTGGWRRGLAGQRADVPSNIGPEGPAGMKGAGGSGGHGRASRRGAERREAA